MVQTESKVQSRESEKIQSINSTLLVSECGINSCGKLDWAKDQIRDSVKSGADAVKFQMYELSDLYTNDELSGTVKNNYLGISKDCKFSEYQHKELWNVAKSWGIEIFWSVFNPKFVDLLESWNVKRYKIASRSIKNWELLERVLKTKKPIIISLGGATDKEIIDVVRMFAHSDVTYLYCVRKYPASLQDYDLNEMVKLKEKTLKSVGVSVHCPDVAIGIKAKTLGASVIEYHTTHNRNLPGCDQSSSLTYQEFEQMAKIIKSMEKL